MKVWRIAVAAVLVGSLVLNVLLWREALRARAETEASRAAAGELDALRTELESIRNTRAVSPQGSNDLELARLRSEIGPLRRQAGVACVSCTGD
ncbi:MAG TPA: hypothetical protein VK530_14135 [Candidatus Acidoferrum sp.]|nr:hypothetical protein [Candidatus Acidoferrum sp.]